AGFSHFLRNWGRQGASSNKCNNLHASCSRQQLRNGCFGCLFLGMVSPHSSPRTSPRKLLGASRLLPDTQGAITALFLGRPLFTAPSMPDPKSAERGHAPMRIEEMVTNASKEGPHQVE